MSKRTKDALAAAKKRGKRLGGRRRKIIVKDAKDRPIYGDVANGSVKGRAAAVRAIRARADARAADLSPIINDIRASGATTLSGIAGALAERGITTPRGKTTWSPSQVAHLLARL